MKVTKIQANEITLCSNAETMRAIWEDARQGEEEGPMYSDWDFDEEALQFWLTEFKNRFDFLTDSSESLDINVECQFRHFHGGRYSWPIHYAGSDELLQLILDDCQRHADEEVNDYARREYVAMAALEIE